MSLLFVESLYLFIVSNMYLLFQSTTQPQPITDGHSKNSRCISIARLVVIQCPNNYKMKACIDALLDPRMSSKTTDTRSHFILYYIPRV